MSQSLPTRPRFDRETARRLCRASADAYAATGDDREILDAWDAESVELIEFNDNQCVVIGLADRIIVAFRGTESIKDAKKDATAIRRRVNNATVHKGFFDAVSQISDTVIAAVTDCSAESIEVTGHSLGGAMATLFAFLLPEELQKRVTAIYTFGSPRVGDANFCDAFHRVFPFRYFRVVHGNDVVPRVPIFFRTTLGIFPEWLPVVPLPHRLRHCGWLIYLTEDGHVLGIHKQPGTIRVATERVIGFRADMARDHMLTHYQEAL